MPASTGSATLSTSTARAVVSLPLARSPVVSTRATATTTPVLAVATPGRSTTPRATGDTVRCRTWGVHRGWWLWKISLFEDVFIPTKTRFCDYVIESSGCEPNATDLSDRMLAKTFLSLFISMIPLTKYDNCFSFFRTLPAACSGLVG